MVVTVQVAARLHDLSPASSDTAVATSDEATPAALKRSAMKGGVDARNGACRYPGGLGLGCQEPLVTIHRGRHQTHDLEDAVEPLDITQEIQSMSITRAAQTNHDELFPNHQSTLKVIDPEFVERFDNLNEVIPEPPR
jgi:hypothetical protein